MLVQRARNYYNSVCNSLTVPFLCISHDGWDSKDNDLLGVSIHLLIPDEWLEVNLDVGIRRIVNKQSQGICDKINKILRR